MEAHRLLTAAGAVLLVVTFLLNSQHAESQDAQGLGGGFNYAYVTGSAMVAAFVASFAVFTKQKMNRGFAS